MNRARRTAILIDGSHSLAMYLAAEIANNHTVTVLEEPHNGLVMLKVREGGKKSLFYLGELLITECKVQLNNAIGIGIVKGDERELAYHLAVIDAAFAAGLPETANWPKILLQEEACITSKSAARAVLIRNTQVSFETMDAKGRSDENGPSA